MVFDCFTHITEVHWIHRFLLGYMGQSWSIYSMIGCVVGVNRCNPMVSYKSRFRCSSELGGYTFLWRGCVGFKSAPIVTVVLFSIQVRPSTVHYICDHLCLFLSSFQSLSTNRKCPTDVHTRICLQFMCIYIYREREREIPDAHLVSTFPIQPCLVPITPIINPQIFPSCHHVSCLNHHESLFPSNFWCLNHHESPMLLQSLCFTMFHA